jgi:predicted permease
MRRLRAWFSRLGAVFGKQRREQELATEMDSHLQLHMDENVRAGMSPAQARREAIMKLGGVEQTKENYRERRGLPLLETLLQDARYAFRVLRKNLGFTVVAVLTMALGIAVNTTIFSFVSGILLRTPPIPDPSRAMVVSSKNPAPVWGADRSPVSASDFQDWRSQSTSFSAMATASFDDMTLSGSIVPERLSGARVTSDYFRVMCVSTALGRAFLPEEFTSGPDHVAILSEALYKERFGGDLQALGRTIKLNGVPYTIVGVMPGSFALWEFEAQVWVPLVFRPDDLSSSARSDRHLQVFARLKPGVAQAQAASEMEAVARQIAQAHPDTNKGWGANVMSVQQYTVADANVGTAVVFLMGAVGFVLLIACANVANLLLARNSARQREFSIRAVLGAGRFRIVLQLLTECLMLSVAGGGLGVLLASAGVRIVRAQINWNSMAISLAQQIYIDRRVLFFTLGVSILAALVFGLAPAWQGSRTAPRAGLQDGSRGMTAGRERNRLQQVLVIGELALALILLVGAGLFVKGFLEELRAKPGLDPEGVLTATVPLGGLEYMEARRQRDFYSSVLRELEHSPQVESAAATTSLPFTFPDSMQFTMEGNPVSKPDERPIAGYFSVSPGYFSTLRIPLLQGREFSAADNLDSLPVAIVDEAFVRRYLPNVSPVGQHVLLRDAGTAAKWSEIVGVVGNVVEYSGQQEPRPHIFESFLAHPGPAMSVIVRTRAGALNFADSLRRAVWAVDPGQAVTNLRTMARVIADSGQGDDVMAELMGTFAILALVMAAIGIYGVLSYLVGERTHEIGIRLALGARPQEILRMVVRKAMTLVGLGVAIGFSISLALPKLFAASFTGFYVQSAWIVGTTPFIVVAVALLSCYVPARRSTKIEPMVALRQD